MRRRADHRRRVQGRLSISLRLAARERVTYTVLVAGDV